MTLRSIGRRARAGHLAVRRKFSLAHSTVIRLAPPRVIDVAARTGYDTVGLRLIGGTDITPAYPLMDNKPVMRAAKAAIVATGVGVLDIEFVRITPESTSRRSSLCGGRRGAGRQIHDCVRLRPRSQPVHGPAGRGQRPGFAIWTARGARVLSVDRGSWSRRGAENRRGGRAARTGDSGRHAALQPIGEHVRRARRDFPIASALRPRRRRAGAGELYDRRADARRPRGASAARRGRHRYQAHPQPYASGHPGRAGGSNDGHGCRGGEEAVALRVRQAAERLLTA